MARHKAYEEIGPWRLLELLGSGANAEVWRATDDSSRQTVALKVLKSVNPQSDSYRRFRDEIASLQGADDVPGILPILASSLPESPHKRDPAWLAMPEAIRIRDALKDSPLEDIVGAMASVAEALAELAQRGVFHRDLKPENLYRNGEGWGVGDFGLVEFPDKESLTEENRKLGPMGYIAPEMLANAAVAHAGPADVYSLAKTLWVLAAGQNYPIQGELRTDREGARISDVVSHARAHYLDRLLERATADRANDRPSMAAFASELRAWLTTPSSPTPQPDLSELATRVASTLGPGLLAERRREEYAKLAHDQFQELHAGLQRLTESLNAVGLRGQLTTRGDRTVMTAFLPRRSVTTAGGEVVLWHYHATLRVRTPEGATLWSGVALEVFDDGTIDLAGAHLIGMSERNLHGPHSIGTTLWRFTKTVAVGSAEQAVAASQLLANLEAEFPTALEAFLEHAQGTR